MATIADVYRAQRDSGARLLSDYELLMDFIRYDRVGPFRLPFTVVNAPSDQPQATAPACDEKAGI